MVQAAQRWFSFGNRYIVLVLVLLFMTWNVTSAAASSMQGRRPAGSGQADEAEWLIMVYSVADDNVLEEDMMIDLQEMEFIGSSDDVHIVVQVDRYDGAFDGMGDFTSTKRYYITQDDDINEISSQEIEDLGEANMADGQTLFEFIVWATENFPARQNMLIFSDHGSGWPGGFGDPDPGVAGADEIFLLDVFGVDNLWLMEIDRTLEAALAETGIDQFDIVGFDACLMAQLEVFTAIAPHARYAVASQETEPSVGWSYVAVLDALTQEPDMDAAALARVIVDTYIHEDIRLYDPDFAGGLAPETVAEELFHDVTLSAVDLSLIPDLNRALDALVSGLTAIDQKSVATARSYARAYESVFGEDWPSPYIDLANFAELIAENSQDERVQSAAQTLISTVQSAVIAERHGVGRKGSNGITIYFPVPKMVAVGDNFGYATVAARFAETTQWDEFLAFHAGGGASVNYNRPKPNPAQALSAAFSSLTPEEIDELQTAIADYQANEYTPEEIAGILLDEGWDEEIVDYLVVNDLLGGDAASPEVAPSSVAKPIRVSPITLSAEVASPDEPVTVEAEIRGERLGYIYTFIGRYLPSEDVLIIEDMDYIFADENEEIGDVTYPIWPDDAFVVEFDWQPTVYAISDGETSIRVLFEPESYGDSPTYTVNAIYHFADGSPDRYATLYFREGEMVRALAFTGADLDATGAPWPIQTKPGDAVTVLEQGYDLSSETEDGSYTREAGTLTLGEEPLFIEETPAPSGNYVVGIIAEDLDGNTYESYEPIFVVNEDADAEDGLLPYVNDDLSFALLYPESWEIYENEGIVILSEAAENAFIQVEQHFYEEASDTADVNTSVIKEAMDRLADEFGLAEIEFAEEPVEYWLGAFDSVWLDFTAEMDGTAVSGVLLASTPAPGFTYLIINVAVDEIYEEMLPLFEGIFYSFDVLISGVERQAASTSSLAITEVLFADDFSDSESGLWMDEEEYDWGLGYYDLENEIYTYELASQSGVIYDYYAAVELDDVFAFQSTVGYLGSWNNVYGVIFQVMDDESFYAFRISGDGYFIVEKTSADGSETLIDWTIADVIATEEEDVNVLTVVGQNGFYDLYINEQWVGDFSDDSYSGGSIGVIAENLDEESTVTVFFDDFTVGIPE